MLLLFLLGTGALYGGANLLLLSTDGSFMEMPKRYEDMPTSITAEIIHLLNIETSFSAPFMEDRLGKNKNWLKYLNAR